MSYDIVRTHGSLLDLRRLVEHAIQSNGWQPLGAPFFSEGTREWCQAMTGPPAKPNEVRLVEPKRK